LNGSIAQLPNCRYRFINRFLSLLNELGAKRCAFKKIGGGEAAYQPE
jgi:hypothetical protein